MRIARPAGGAGGPIELTTERVVLETGAQRLTTDAPVAIVQGANRINAVGLTAELGRERIRLEHRVRGTYVVR